MTERTYVVAGATGHVGSIVANTLLDSKMRVRIIARNAERMKPLVERGAEPMAGNLEDVGFLRKALEGAQAAFFLTPPNFTLQSGFRAWQNEIAKAQVEALKGSSVTHVATLSSIGAHIQNGVGPVSGMYDMEQLYKSLSNIQVLHVRPAYFMENHLTAIPTIKQMGAIVGALKADAPIPMIATRDIGTVIGRRLLELDFKGHSALELLGPADVSMNEVAKVFGRIIEKPDLKYMQVSYDDAKKGMVGAGVPEELAGLYMEMTRAFNEGTIKATQPRSAQTQTPTTLETFAKTVFGPAYVAAS